MTKEIVAKACGKRANGKTLWRRLMAKELVAKVFGKRASSGEGLWQNPCDEHLSDELP